MKKIILILVILCALAGGSWYGYQKLYSKHYLIEGAEESLRNLMKFPSSFVLKNVVFYVENDKIPIMRIEYEAKNSFNRTLLGICSIYFRESISEFYDNDHEKIRHAIEDRTCTITPFEDFAEISSVYINNEQVVDKFVLVSFQADISMARRNYSGPSLGGRAEKLNQDGSIQYSFKMTTYTPGNIFPYSYDY